MKLDLFIYNSFIISIVVEKNRVQNYENILYIYLFQILIVMDK